MILVVDNYDSFVFNVARYVVRLGRRVEVVRNDEVSVGAVEALAPEAVIVSPGPCSPREAGISPDLVARLSGRLPILGVCLGHQVIGDVFGGRVTRALHPMHGRASLVSHAGTRLFEGLGETMQVGRYHSLIVEETAPMRETLLVDARSREGEIMALSHRAHPTFGIQFHPESVLTVRGEAIFENFLRLSDGWHGRDLD
ncbi:aminodeoxychorismate/anthranilate synthase component II [Aurantimonas sp. Leaf443]|uniref:anthranilate synthase component II n=1 Tax=Aurantimonas sp. Leaf443 TaxID=1736378 RepID=UPI0006FF003F|nr:aminodeoxychorismate/anthranilate synthase component II [Aurantimonas sp. Leaf443]KQT83066.1 anthranilate synthase [Aurantimonas sp. Leaf443]